MSKLELSGIGSASKAGKPGQGQRETASLAELSQEYHLFTLGPVYIGACLDKDLLEVFAEQSGDKFSAATCEQAFPMFHNLNEWNVLVQGIERSDDLGDAKAAVRKDRLTEKFSQFLLDWRFMRKETNFYARLYSRPVVIIPPGDPRGISVEVWLLMSNKGTQRLRGANPYYVTVTDEVNDDVAKEADAALDLVRGGN